MDILIATRNKGKVTEFSEYFKPKNINIYDLNSLSIDSSPEEPYDSFLMNSFHKARYYSQFTEMAILSDDSGLQVKCLNDAYLIRTQKGVNGHGYDPIFYIEKYSKTLGELDIILKNEISHRAKALAKLIKFIETNQRS